MCIVAKPSFETLMGKLSFFAMVLGRLWLRDVELSSTAKHICNVKRWGGILLNVYILYLQLGTQLILR